jgi:hypothetical protein
MGAISIPAPALNGVILRTVHRAPVIQMVKQTVKPFSFPEKGVQRRDNLAAIDTCCGLVKVYRTHHQPIAAPGKE